VSQALFSSVLHTRAAEKALEEEDGSRSAPLGEALSAIGELTRRAQREMRMFIFEWGPDGVGDGLVTAFTRHASSLRDESGFVVDVVGPEQRLPLARTTQTQLYGIGREALANVVRHSGARSARVRVQADNLHVVVEVADDGCGFDPRGHRPGHYGLESMRSRTEEIGGVLDIMSAAGRGTVIRVVVPAESSGQTELSLD
jgi:signal transduction histidine kinase